MPYVSTNPSNTSDVVTEIELGTSRTFVDAAQRAKAAQRAWARVPAPVRGQVIGNIGRLVEANFEPLAQLVTREIGKPIAEARGEVQEIVDTANFFVGEGRRLYGQTVPSEMADKQLFTFRVPVGVSVIITAGNFPVAVPSWYVVPARATSYVARLSPIGRSPRTSPRRRARRWRPRRPGRRGCAT